MQFVRSWGTANNCSTTIVSIIKHITDDDF